MENEFEIDIKITPNDESEAFSLTKKSRYFSSHNGRNCSYDDILFKNNMINISGSRKVNIDSEDALFTVQSTYQLDILKAFIYYWFRWGGFQIKSIVMTINGEQKKELGIEDINDNFEGTVKSNFDLQKIESIFDVENDQNSFICSLLYQILGIERADFYSSWKAFNRIYNTVFSTKKDTESIKKLLSQIKDNVDDDWNVSVKSREFVEEELSDKRIYRWMYAENNNEFPKIASFIGKTGLDNYIDVDLINRFMNILDYKYENIANDVERQRYHNIRDYHSSKDERRLYKNILENRSKNLHSNFDYLQLVITYAQYLRNKYFHGVYKDSTIIFKENVLADELGTVTEILQDLNWYLLDKYEDKLVEHKKVLNEN